MTHWLKRSLWSAVCVGCAGGALGQQAVTLTLDASSGDPSVGGATNRLAIDVGALGTNDQASTDFSGSVEALLDLSYDAGHNPTATGLELESGNLSATDVSLSLAGGFLAVELTGLGATVDTPTPPGLVAGGQFDTALHTLLINQGNISAAGQNIDLSATPVAGTSAGTGTLLVTLNNISGTTATYDVVLNLPVSFTDTFSVPNPLGGADVDVNVGVDGGDVVARGQFTRVVPEPGSLAVLGLGGLALVRRRRA